MDNRTLCTKAGPERELTRAILPPTG